MGAETVSFLYRYRPAIILPGCDGRGGERECKGRAGKDVIDEIQRREIFLGTLKEHNDPMDGMLDIYWEGDEIVWKSFISHYCLCIVHAFGCIFVMSDEEVFDASWVNFRITKDTLAEKGQQLFECFVDGVLANSCVTKFIRSLADKGVVHSDELRAYLMAHHNIFVDCFRRAERNIYGLESVHFSDDYTKMSKDFFLGSQELSDILANGVRGDVRHALSCISNRMAEQVFMLGGYKAFREFPGITRFKRNVITILTQFPVLYVEAAADSVYDEYYLASFSEKNDDPTMWGHYAQGHRGVCLVFRFEQDEHGSYLETDNQERLRLYKVNYDDVPPKVNVFENIGYLSRSDLYRHWLHRDGRTSSLAAHYGSDYAKWYWDGFSKKVSHKFTPWERESEYRLIDTAWLTGKKAKQQRIIRYNQNHLIGVIFGFRMDENVKLKIMHHFDKVLDSEAKKSFKFYQARYTAFDKKLEIAELSLLKFA